MAKGEGGGGHWRERQLAKKASVSRRPDTPEVLAAIVKPKAKPVVKPKAKVRIPKPREKPQSDFRPGLAPMFPKYDSDIPLTPPNRAAKADQLQRPNRAAKVDAIPLTPPNRMAKEDQMQRPNRMAMDDMMQRPNRMAMGDQMQGPPMGDMEYDPFAFQRVAWEKKGNRGSVRLKDIARVPRATPRFGAR